MDEPRKFEGFKKVFDLNDGEKVMGMANWAGDLLVATNHRVLVYDPRVDKLQELTFRPEK